MVLFRGYLDNMWEINLSNQIISFILSLCLGSILCVLYDFIRAMRKVGFNSFLAVFFTDVLFWIVTAFVTFIFLIARTNGEIRGFVLLGELFGFIVFRLTFSRLILKIFLFIAKIAVFLFGKINNIIVMLYVVFENTSKKLMLYFSTAFKSVKKVLKNRGEVLYTNNDNVIMENDINETKTEA